MISKAEAIKLGARGLEVPQQGLRPESFAYLSAGGKPLPSLPVTIVFWSDGKRSIQDGRHRITMARERGEQSIPGKMKAYGPRGGVVWSFTGKVPI